MIRSHRFSRSAPRPSWTLRVLWALIIVICLPIVLGAAYAFVPVPATPLMVIRLFEGYGFSKDWMPMNQISPYLPRAVIAAEDNLFCSHDGFDWEAIEKARDYNAQSSNVKRGRKKGASTLSQQVAKNLFLWPGRTWVRKGLEVPLTVYLETVLTKRRLLEIYLNVVEWAPGVYGAEAAARHYFGVPAKKLTLRQASLMAAILPKPLGWSASKPSGFVNFRANRIQKRVPSLGGTDSVYLSCLNSPK